MRSYPFTSQVTYDDEGLPLYDRAVDSSFLRRVFAQYFSDGVFYKPTSALQVVADTGMQVAVEPGCCHIQGAIGIEDSRRTLVVQAAESLDRIDTVVARLDLSLAARDIDLYVVKGTAAASPQPPELTRDATVWELGLANLFVAKNTQTISQQRITDTRLDSARCGVVAQTIGALDTEPYYTQLSAMIDDLREVIAGIEAGSEVMLKAVYDPEGNGIPVEHGGTGAGTKEQALANLGALPAVGYSTEEVATGQTWIDGKPLFKRTFEIDLQSDPFSFDTGITAGTLDTVFIGAESFCVYVDSSAGNAQTIYPASSVYAANEAYNTLFFVKPDYTATVTIDWRGGTGWNGQKAYITLYYTKK